MLRNFVAAILLLFVTSVSIAQIRLPAIFGDHMVLEQKSDVAFWGWSGASEELTITTSWNKLDPIKIKAPSSGNWKVSLKTPAAGGPHTITVKGHGDPIIIQDILIGEVWLCSGQSNMQWGMGGSIDGAAEVATATNQEIRLFLVNTSSADYPQVHGEGHWQVCSPESVKNFSAVGYFFGKKLNADLKVPVGLIGSSWGGTPAEAWTPKERVLDDPALKESASKQKEVPWGPIGPGVIYNGMIRPLVPFNIAGVIWYQGEANTVASSTYQSLMKALIDGWRADFGKEFPFYLVQIAPFKYGRPYEGVLIRDQQSKVISTVPKTGLVIISDAVEDVNDIHPKRKKPVGDRLANYALGDTYGRPLLGYQSPLYKSMRVDKGKIVISFYFSEIGLISQGGDPTQFMIAGEDHVFVPAVAKIDGGTVVVSAKTVKNPVAVRFCWDNTSIPNLFNKEGLPVTAFRTDDWELDMSGGK